MGQVDSLKTGKKFKKTEIGEIPVDWEVLNLNSISNEIYRYPTYYNIKYVETGIPEVRGELIKPNGTLETDMSKYRFISQETAMQFPRTCLREGDFVISVRGTMGKVTIIPRLIDGANMTANLMRISPDRNKIFPLFLHQVLISDNFQKILNITSSSTTIKTIKAPELKRLKFAIPPLAEQKKIAEILTTVDEAIEKSNEIVEKTKELKKGLMQELLTRGIGHKKFKKTSIGEVPEDWGVVTIVDICEVIGGSTPSTNKKEYWNGDILWAVPTDITKLKGNIISNTEKKITKVGLSACAARLLPEGSILLTSRATIGACAINTKPMATNQGFASLICKANVHNLFIFYKIVSMRKKLERLGSGSTFKETSKRSIRAIRISLPPLHEQKRIAEILSAVDEDIEREVDNKKELEIIKKALMQVLLTGKVRVKGV